MPEEFYNDMPVGLMPAVVLMWAGMATMMFYAAGSMIAYMYARN